jgi:CBS domain-containing protein
MAQRPIGDIIRRAPVTLAPTATVQDACRLMRDQRIGAILVVDPAGALAGIFTGRDAVKLLADGHNAVHTRLDRVMTRNPECIRPGDHALDALRTMSDGGFRHLPVLDGSDVVGIVSVGDFRSMEHARLDEETGYWERI